MRFRQSLAATGRRTVIVYCVVAFLMMLALTYGLLSARQMLAVGHGLVVAYALGDFVGTTSARRAADP